MAVRLSRPKFTWILYISLFPWLTTYGLRHFACLDNEKTNRLWCGTSQHFPKCNRVTCVQKDASSIQRGRVLYKYCPPGKHHKYGYEKNYIWTSDCCIIAARICYIAKAVDSIEDETDDEETSIEHAPTMKTTDVEKWVTIPIDIFNSTGIEDMVELTMPTNLELKTEEYTETKSSMIGLYAGLPVGLFLILAVLAVICYIFRGKLKIVAGKFRSTHKEGLYQESKMTSISSTRNDASRTFANQEYEMHDDQENSKSEYTSKGAYEFSKSRSEPERNEPFHYDTIETETKSSGFKSEYETIGIGESCNTYDTAYHAAQESFYKLSYDNILGSITKASHGNEGSTEYDNATV